MWKYYSPSNTIPSPIWRKIQSWCICTCNYTERVARLHAYLIFTYSKPNTCILVQHENKQTSHNLSIIEPVKEKASEVKWLPAQNTQGWGWGGERSEPKGSPHLLPRQVSRFALASSSLVNLSAHSTIEWKYDTLEGCQQCRKQILQMTDSSVKVHVCSRTCYFADVC